MTSPPRAALSAFDDQVDVLIGKGYPALLASSPERFRRQLDPLRQLAGSLTQPCVLVPPPTDLLAQVAQLRLGSRPGFTSMTAEELARFRPTAELAVPAGAYLLVDVETGEDTLGVAPEQALPRLVARGRTPLTLEEGLAVGTQHPEWLRGRCCFEMLGSRAGDRRVTGLWVKADGRPRLGWCWWGAPHGWLGAASAATRLGTG